MNNSIFALVGNIGIALVIAVAFLVLSYVRSGLSAVRWFGISYAIGAATPASELLVHFSDTPQIFVATSYATFCLSLHVMAYGLAKYYRYKLATSLLVGSFAASMLVRAAIWNGPRNTLPYELYYQLPFTTSLLICAFVMSRVSPQRFLDSLLGFAFVVTSLHFLVKPYMAVVLGSGATATEYVNSRYALFSQSATAVLVIATALALLLVVVRDTLEAARREADTDDLSGLFNRRAFNREAAATLSRAEKKGRDCVALVFDLDHFKAINDTHGHSAGDVAIQGFSSLLKTAADERFVVGRTGGEEFSVLMPERSAAEGVEWAERVRAMLRERVFRDQDREYRVTVSCGAALALPGESLEAALRRSDAALYAAKQRGRDCVTTSPPRDAESPI